MGKKKMILTSLAVLGAAFAVSQPSVVKAAEDTNTGTSSAQPVATHPEETGATDTSKSEVTSPEIKQAETDAKKAEEKVTEAQAKVDKTTPVADEAAKNLETEKKEAAEAEAKKEEDAKKEEADSKDASSKALDQLENEIDADANIKDKEAAKKLLGKEDLLAAVESGDLKAGDVLKELEKDDATAGSTSTTPAEAKSKATLPEDIKAGIEKAEKADAARPASEKTSR